MIQNGDVVVRIISLNRIYREGKSIISVAIICHLDILSHFVVTFLIFQNFDFSYSVMFGGHSVAIRAHLYLYK